MGQKKQLKKGSSPEEKLQRLQELKPIDDEFMRCLFKDNIPLAQLVLRIITGKDDLEIVECRIQEDMKRLAGARSICLDAYGTDSANRKYDLEIQRASKGARPHRARYHSSVMDIENLGVGQEFEELPDTYTIFITERDFFGMGEAIYPVERINLVMDAPFNDGEHIVYVNGEYRGDSPIERLMHEFNCTDADDMNYALMAERTRYLKEKPEGVSEMSAIIEEMCNEAVYFNSLEIAKRMITGKKATLEEIAEYTGLPLDEIVELTGIQKNGVASMAK